MHDSNDSGYDSQGYDLPTLPYIPYAHPPLEQQPTDRLPSHALNDPPDISYGEAPLSFPETLPSVPSEPALDQLSTEPIPAIPPTPRKRLPRLWILLGGVVVLLLLSSAAT